MKNKNILVIGGCGYKTYHITNQIAKHNNVVVIDDLIKKRGTVYSVDDSVSVYQIDIRDRKRVQDVFRENKIDKVIDLITRKYNLQRNDACGKNIDCETIHW